MVHVTLLGGGNLANHLASVFLEAEGIILSQIYNRTFQNIEHLRNRVEITDDLSNLKPVDIYILAVSDEAISRLSLQLKHLNGLLVHTSGAMDMDTLQPCKRIGVFYPLQTFTKSKKVDFNLVPICIEAQETKDLFLLETMANCISKQVYKIDSLQRNKLHVAAVFVNNFVNYLYTIGEDICVENQIPFEILQPLILETAKKINDIPPALAQTGPAMRNDTKTFEIHKQSLNANQTEIYTLLTKAILKNR